MINRYKTAISRKKYSKPLRLALLSGFVNLETTVLDYGCGKGSDVSFLKEDNIIACGYDPYYFPEINPFLNQEISHYQEISQFDIVLLIYVLNVIECPKERLDLLKMCFNNSKQGLLVSVRLKRECPKMYQEYGDGIITRKGTFQKFYTQDEFQSYLFDTLKIQPLILSPGISFISKI